MQATAVDSAKAVRVSFISMYRGEAHYEILGGPLHGSRARVRSMPEKFYQDDWRMGGPWNMTKDEYERDVVGSIGIVNVGGKPVPADVLAAVSAEYEVGRELAPNLHCSGPFCTGSWSEAGWARQDAEGAAPVERDRMRA